MPPEPLPTLADIYQARRRIAGTAIRTPLLRSTALSTLTAAEVHLKLETLQPTGAFKLRGAANRLAGLDEPERRRGVVTVSTGNHGRAVAYASRRLGIRATICLSSLVPRNKVEAIEALGAEARIMGRSQDEAGLEAERLARADGMVPVPPFDDPFVIAGQGTIGLELIEDLPTLDTVLVPLSGGGLIGGIALALKAANPAIRIIGITMERRAAMATSLDAGRPVEVEEVETLADSLGGGIGLDNRLTFRLARDLIDEVILVSEDEIAAGMRHLYRVERLIAEGGAAVVITGGNVDMDDLTRIVGS